MRNPFRRQTETAAPTLRERAADLSARLASTIRKPEATPASTPPVAVEGAPTDFAAALLDGWATWGATLDRLGDDYSDEEADAAVAPMNRLVRSAAELPAIAENIAAKALAYAWRDWVSTERPGQPRDAYDLDGRLVYDLHAAIMARGVANEAAKPRPLDLIAAAGLALDGMSLKEVAMLHDIALMLSDVARAIFCQPRCNPGPFLNNAGKFVDWLGDGLDLLIDATVKELRSREPADWIERGIRLETIAEATVSNGDPAETAAFARELLAKVEA